MTWDSGLGPEMDEKGSMDVGVAAACLHPTEPLVCLHSTKPHVCLHPTRAAMMGRALPSKAGGVALPSNKHHKERLLSIKYALRGSGGIDLSGGWWNSHS